MMMCEEENHFQHHEPHNVEVTELRLSPLQVLLKVDQKRGQLLPPNVYIPSILSVICNEKLGFDLI